MLGGRRIDQVRTGLPQLEMLAHQVVDPECVYLQRLLFGANDNGPKASGEFEAGVAWLLHLLGYSAIHCGRKDLHRAPDVLAKSPTGDLLVVECSLELPGPSKVEDLQSRASAIGCALQAAGLSANVRPAFFTAQQVAEPGPAVFTVDRSRLKDLLHRALTGADTSDILWSHWGS
jgi:hypothetical protein